MSLAYVRRRRQRAESGQPRAPRVRPVASGQQRAGGGDLPWKDVRGGAAWNRRRELQWLVVAGRDGREEGRSGSGRPIGKVLVVEIGPSEY